MKTVYFDDEEKWLEARRGKITGSRLKDLIVLRGKGEKMGFWELVAERLGLPPGEENAMERGHKLEPEALDRFEAATGKTVIRDLAIWFREDDPDIAVSPDGWIGKGMKEAVEVKCLSSARHIQAVMTNEIPDEYHYQVLQYFIVNDKLQTLHFCFYDPRLRVKDFHAIEVTREQLTEEIETTLTYQRDKLKKVEEIVSSLTQF